MSETEVKKPMWAKCSVCNHCWTFAYLPLGLDAMVRILPGVCCPMGCEGAALIAKQHEGKLLESTSTGDAAVLGKD